VSKRRHHAKDNDLTLANDPPKPGLATEGKFGRVVSSINMVKPYVATGRQRVRYRHRRCGNGSLSPGFDDAWREGVQPDARLGAGASFLQLYCGS
jgi:hypothetical protein